MKEPDDRAYTKMTASFTPAQRRKWNELRREMVHLAEQWRDQSMGAEGGMFDKADRLHNLVNQLPLLDPDGKSYHRFGPAAEDF